MHIKALAWGFKVFYPRISAYDLWVGIFRLGSRAWKTEILKLGEPLGQVSGEDGLGRPQVLEPTSAVLEPTGAVLEP